MCQFRSKIKNFWNFVQKYHQNACLYLNVMILLYRELNISYFYSNPKNKNLRRSEMQTAEGVNLHFLAKRAKTHLCQKPQFVSKSTEHYCPCYSCEREFESYYKVMRLIMSDETVYDPIARLAGRELAELPNSSEKQRIILETCSMYATMRNRLRKDLLCAMRQNKLLSVGDICVNPQYVLRKLG